MTQIYIFFLLTFDVGVKVFAADYQGKDDWVQIARNDLVNSLKYERRHYPAKNVVIFIGDGMGPNTVTASRIYRAGESSRLIWEEFSDLGLLKTYANDKQVPDSAATATAMFCGEKVNYYTAGLSSRVQYMDCNASLVMENRLESLASLAQDKGLSTGIVTTTRITHATPASMYARTAHRDWECDAAMPLNSTQCKDIARQLVEDHPGRGFNVIFGGGRKMLSTPEKSGGRTEAGVKPWMCYRADGRNLIREWMESKKKMKLRATYINTTEQLLTTSLESVDYIMGIFSDDHMPFDHLRDKTPQGAPSLEQMTTTAIRLLNKNKKGFLLMVEGGMIDQAHHKGLARNALDEVVELNDAVNATMLLLKQLGILDNTLVIVTSDHTHTLTINGNQNRGSDILGIAATSQLDGVPYTTLSYGTVGPDNYKFRVVDGKVVREDPRTVNTTSYDFHPQGSILDLENNHGGGDVIVYATGPMAYLFHQVHEQHYVFHVVEYAMRLGEFRNFISNSSAVRTFFPNWILFYATLALVLRHNLLHFY